MNRKRRGLSGMNLIKEEHKKGHRNKDENRLQRLEKYYFLRVNSPMGRYSKNCEICKCNKYKRHPQIPDLNRSL